MTAPKISVVIPMYNAERFIRQCLISVLSSKFTDYEVIVVDDCSSDSSVVEVEKLVPYFKQGGLQLFSTQTNSGGPGIPRNVGIKHATGKYITFIDNDDMILPTALGNFFDVAEKFQADVVYSEKFFLFDDVESGDFRLKNLSVLNRCALEKPVDVPTPATNNLRARIQSAIVKEFCTIPWGKLYRRDFLLNNELYFPQLKFGEDGIFGFKCFCLAKTYIYIPQITNLHRVRENSASRQTLDSNEGARVWLEVITENISRLAAFIDTLEICRRDLQFRQEILTAFIDKHFVLMESFFRNIKPHVVEKVFFDELQNPALNSRGKQLITAHLYAKRALTR